MSHYRTLGGKPLSVLRLLFEIGQGDQKREVGILMPCLLELCVQLRLDILPEGKTPWLDHHASARLGILRHVSGTNDLLIPLRKIFLSGGGDGCLILAHVGWRKTTERTG